MGWTHEVGESGRHAPRAARVLRAPGRRGANVGARADATRRGRRGYFARRAVGGVWAGPWRGGCGPMRCPAATRAALPCGRGAGDAGFHVGTVPKRNPASPNQRRVGARSTRAALGAGRPSSGGRAATLRPTRFDRRGDDAFEITILAMNKILLRIEISRLTPHVRGGVAVHFPVRRVVPGGGAPVCTDALNCVPPVATI